MKNSKSKAQRVNKSPCCKKKQKKKKNKTKMHEQKNRKFSVVCFRFYAGSNEKH